MSQNQFKYSTGVVAYPVFFVLAIWIVFWLQVRFFSGIKYFGIYPKTLEGLRGVIFSPFIHSNIEHLYRNTFPLLILSMALFYFYRKIAWKILLYGILISGLITWSIGRPANHIGASSVIYVLASFIFFKGIFAKHYRLVALSFVVVFLYGSMIWYVFPVKEEISWEGHLGGFIAGFIFALLFKKSIAQKESYHWQAEDYVEEEDEFLKHFDENGNFIENLQVEEELLAEENPDEIPLPKITITYTYKEKGS
ncbi:Membrane associated serine protease, rhomboid family [Flavobacteriaceae bacterium MAR_2010_188]|nr:Membrane associated serine protease, rhomboid family [Flavobacteriaceae bacterium MAR_2010_188]